MSASFILVAESGASPPFKSGEVVIAGPPGPHLDGLKIVKYLPHANLTVVKVDQGKEFGTVQKFKSRGRRAGLNYIAHAFSVPNDPLYPQQWNFTAVQSEDAWGLSTGAGVIVAVLDTGIATGGPDGINCIVDPWDFVNNDNSPDDDHAEGHGTHVTGTIAQTTGNGIGVAGLAYDTCIMPLKVLDDSGTGEFADIADAVHYAVDKGAKVINMSLGTHAYTWPIVRNDPLLDPELDYAYANNVTVVCAAGNDGDLWDQNVSYPAIYPTTIAVGATSINNEVMNYSNKGEGLDIVAPGGYITNCILQETLYGDWGYECFWGTSMATPHVAAISAMLISVDPFLTPDQVYQILTTTTLDLNQTGYDSTSGYGLVQAYDALTSLDADGDGMPDSWEIFHNLDPDDPSDAVTDYDSDGLTNLYEYNLGSDPTDPADAGFDYDSDGLTNLEEFNKGTEPLIFDTDNDGVGDGFDGDPLDNQQSACFEPAPIINNLSQEFTSVQAAVNHNSTEDFDTVKITAADFGEDVLFDRDITLTLSGGYYCSYSDNPSTSIINSLIIRNGTIKIENLVIM